MKTIVHFLLDETGSMYSQRDETIRGFNSYVGGLKEQDISITVTKFNSKAVAVLCNDVDIDTTPKLSHANYNPNNSTPLFDAIADSIGRTEEVLTSYKRNKVKVLFVILTDGLENASKRYTREAVLEMIKAKEEEGWTVVYLGANQDAYAESGKIGILYNNTINFPVEDMCGTFNNLYVCTANFTQSNAKQTDKFFDNGTEINK